MATQTWPLDRGVIEQVSVWSILLWGMAAGGSLLGPSSTSRKGGVPAGPRCVEATLFKVNYPSAFPAGFKDPYPSLPPENRFSGGAALAGTWTSPGSPLT